MKFQIIKGKNEKNWREKLSLFDKFFGLRGYKEIEYLNLYLNNNTSIESFFIEENDNFFFMPYVKKKISISGFENYYDIESAYGYSGPITNCYEEKFLEKVINIFNDYCFKQNIIACLIRFDPFTNLHSKLNNGKINLSYEGDIVYKTLNNDKSIIEDYKQSVKNKISKAEKEGIKICISDNYENFQGFVQLYTKFMKEKKANQDYIYKKDYFEKVFSKLNRKFDFFKIYIDNSNNILGGALVLKSAKTASIHLSVTSNVLKKNGASVLLRHEITKFYKNHNFNLINYGGGLSKSPNDSLFKFKKNFSKETKQYFIGKMIINEEIYNNIRKNLKETNQINNNYKHYLFFYKYEK